MTDTPIKTFTKQSSKPRWYNQPNAIEQINQHAPALSPTQQNQIKNFIEQGFCILPKAIPEDLIDEINAAYDRASEFRDVYLVRKGGEYFRPGPLGIVGRRKRLIDFYVPCAAALQAVLDKQITAIFNCLYQETPLAFQSLLFQFGSKQTLHQDPAYVIINEPDALLASWIALEDIQPGSGELVYYPGSHRNVSAAFDDDKDTWNRSQDSIDSNHQYSQRLENNCQAQGLQQQNFQAKKGDVLLWHARLAHGGGPVIDEELTRKSLVTHYCPVSCAPRYFELQPDQAYQRAYGDGYYASRHYDIHPDAKSLRPVYTGGKDLYNDSNGTK